MNGVIGVAGLLCASALCTAAMAQQPLVQTQPNDRMVSAPVVVQSGTVIGPQTTADTSIPTAAPVTSIATAAPQAAPFRPAPLGTYMETTADKRVVIAKNGYLMITDVNGRRDESIAMFTDGLGGGQIYPPGIPAQFWPLEVGKSVTFNYGANGPLSVTTRVLRTETITVPAGTFFTYVVERRVHPSSDFREDVATYWYAPSVGYPVKFVENRLSGAARRPYDMVSIVLPHPLDGTIPVTTPGDSPDRRAQFCSQNGTAIQMPDGRSIAVPCVTYVEAHLPAYTAWLNSSQAAGMPR
jgi:hypothetical protein